MDKVQKKKLEWFLKFINLDLEILGKVEKAFLILEMSIVQGFMPDDESLFDRVPTRMLDNLIGADSLEFNKLHASVRGLFERLMEKYVNLERKHKQLAGSWLPSEEYFSMRCLEIYDVRLSLRPSVDVAIMHNSDEDDLDESPFTFVRWDQEAVGGAHLRLITLAKEPQHALLFHFLQTLDGVQFSAFRKCLNCDGWFLHTSARARKYCSQRCASKSGSKRRYQKLMKDSAAYEAELEKARDRAHKSYKKRVQSKVPGSKVQRRPRKKKEGKED
jgi:hypothetical protein